MYTLEMQQYLPALPVFRKGEGTDIRSNRIEFLGDSRRIIRKWMPDIPEQRMAKSFHLPVRRDLYVVPILRLISLPEKFPWGFFQIISKMKLPSAVQGKMVCRRYPVVFQGLFDGLKRHQSVMRQGLVAFKNLRVLPVRLPLGISAARNKQIQKNDDSQTF